MEKVTSLFSRHKKIETDEVLIEELEELLVLAKEGKIKEIVMLSDILDEADDESTGYIRTFIKSRNYIRSIGLIELLKTKF